MSDKDRMGIKQNTDFDKKVREIDSLIQSGNVAEARRLIGAISKKSVPIECAHLLAALARRVGQPEIAITLLRPILHPVKKLLALPKDEDKLEYGASLLRVGAQSEAVKLLKSVSAETFPQALFFQALALIKSWDCADAVPLLRTYLLKEKAEYRVIDGKVNLALCLLWMKSYPEAQTLLVEILDYGDKNGFPLHSANARRFFGVLHFYQKNWEEALDHLKKADAVFGPIRGLEALFVKKWVSLTKLYQSPESKEARMAVEEVRREALQLRHWETLRDLDHHLAVLCQDAELFQRLYFGTPYEAYKRRIETELSAHEMPDMYEWKLPENCTDPKIDILSGASALVPPGKVLHRLFTTLVSDFYKPFNIPGLFESMFPDDFYSVTSSKLRVAQGIKRLRGLLSEKKLPLTVAHEQGAYFLTSKEGCAIVIRKSQKVIGAFEYRKQLLQEKFLNRFTLKEAMQVLDLSKSATHEFIQEAIQAGTVSREAHGGESCYRIVQEFKKAG